VIFFGKINESLFAKKKTGVKNTEIVRFKDAENPDFESIMLILGDI